MHKRVILHWIVGIGLMLAGRSAHADQITIGAFADATILSEDETRANGAGSYIFSGNTDAGGQRRALLLFDIAGNLPTGATINSVSLQLVVTRSQIAGNRTVELRRVTTFWSEGPTDPSGEEGGGDSAQLGDVTWRYTHYDPNDEAGSPQWTTLGGDFSPTLSAQSTVGAASTTPGWSSAQMTADVQGWLDAPATNLGWILKDQADGGTGTAKQYGSRENAQANERPQLTIDFTPVQVAGACCGAGGSGSCSVVVSGTCGGTYQGDGSSCTPNPCPTGCCLPNAQAQCVEVDTATCTAQGGTVQGMACAMTDCPVLPTPFADPLPLPATATSVAGTPGGVATYDIAMREIQQQLHLELPPTTVWGYGDGPSGASYPGPTIEATTGNPITVNWINDLRDTSQLGDPLRSAHYLPVDTCPHGAQDNAKTVVHLHGGHVPSDVDGQPEATFLPGSQDTYVYPNNQDAATLWYHDHALGITRLNVYMGLAGFYLVRDPVENALGLPSGEFEIPLAIQDRSFNPDGSLEYPVFWQDMFLGETMLVNGKVWPRHDVKQGKYRLRILNGCNTRTLTLQVCPGSNASPCPAPATFQLIGQEGGLLPAPLPLTEITLGPAERADVVVDFAPYAASSSVYLVNSAPAPFPGAAGVGVIADVMRFDVQGVPGFLAPVPGALRPMEILNEANATQHRYLELVKGPGDACSPFAWEIVSTDGLNGAVLGSRWMDITEQPVLGDTEVWSFINRSGMMHPMHMHLVFFQILDRETFTEVGGTIVPSGVKVPSAAHEMGWKDTVQVGPNEIVRVIARFEDYEGLFPYHCHILEHEDHEMMRQMRVLPEPVVLLGLASGVLLLAGLARRRASR